MACDQSLLLAHTSSNQLGRVAVRSSRWVEADRLDRAVSLGRVREVEKGFKGTLFLATDTNARETVPVARRHAPHLRQALGL